MFGWRANFMMGQLDRGKVPCSKNENGKIMLKIICKKLVWIALPLGLAVGCAENRPATEASYGPPPDVVLQPTSAEPEQRIYRETAATPTGVDATVTTTPAGVSPENWAVAEEIRQKLESDATLAPLGSTLIANVSKDGVVTLKGNVSSPSEQQRMSDSISNLPGVHGIDNQLVVGRTSGSGTLKMQ
jgi:hypothetical protein